jgi:hypothetical protein
VCLGPCNGLGDSVKDTGFQLLFIEVLEISQWQVKPGIFSFLSVLEPDIVFDITRAGLNDVPRFGHVHFHKKLLYHSSLVFHARIIGENIAHSTDPCATIYYEGVEQIKEMSAACHPAFWRPKIPRCGTTVQREVLARLDQTLSHKVADSLFRLDPQIVAKLSGILTVRQ